MNIKTWWHDVFSFRMPITWERHWIPVYCHRSIRSTHCVSASVMSKERNKDALCKRRDACCSVMRTSLPVCGIAISPLEMCLHSHWILLDQDENISGRFHIGGVCVSDEQRFRSLLPAVHMYDRGLERMAHRLKHLRRTVTASARWGFPFLDGDCVTDENGSLAS